MKCELIAMHTLFTQPELPASLFSELMDWYMCFDESDEQKNHVRFWLVVHV